MAIANVDRAQNDGLFLTRYSCYAVDLASMAQVAVRLSVCHCG